MGIKSVLDDILYDLPTCRSLRVSCAEADAEWRVEFEYDRVTFSGRGETPEAALVEARVDKQISDYYYAAPSDAPALTQEEMTMRLRDAYRTWLGEWPPHEYRGEYAGRPDAPHD